MRPLCHLSTGVVRIERVVSRLMVVGFVGLITTNVAMRYLVGRPIVFAEELAAILLVWLAFVAISISIHDRTQIGVTLVVDLLSRRLRRLRRIAGIVVNVAVLGILVVLLWKSLVWVTSPAVAFEQVITVGWAKAPFFWIVPVFCTTALLHVAAQTLDPRTLEG